MGPPPTPAKAYLAGVEITLAEGWKTYWRTPGDAGVPPAFDWTGSTNVAAIKVRYPAPIPDARGGRADHWLQDGGHLSRRGGAQRRRPSPSTSSLRWTSGSAARSAFPPRRNSPLTLAPPQLEGKASPELLAALERVPRPQASRRTGDPQLERVTASLDGEHPRLLIEARFPQGARGADVFVEAPDGLYVPQPKRLPDGAGATPRFEVDLSRGDNARELKGKTLTLTLVSDAGAT